MTNYNEILDELCLLEKEPQSTFRKAVLLYWKTIIGSYDYSLKQRKSKLKSIEKEYNTDDYDMRLFDFFGSGNITDQESKLKILRKRLNKIRKA